MSFSRGGDDQNAASDLSAVASHPRSSSSDCTQVASEEGPLPLDLNVLLLLKVNRTICRFSVQFDSVQMHFYY